MKAGQPLFVVEAPDMVQAQNDFITAISNLNKARSALELAKIVEQQNKTLYDSRAGALRDLQTVAGDHARGRKRRALGANFTGGDAQSACGFSG